MPSREERYREGVFHRLARLVVCFAAVQILGGHWLALQSVAWIGMIAENARGETLVVAIEKTFDGAHPCSLCRVVKDGREQERKQEVAKLILKLDAVLSAASLLPSPVVTDWSYRPFALVALARTNSPPTPPPLA